MCDSHTMLRAPAYTGPWTTVGSIPTTGGLPATYEDAFLWMTPDLSSWHIIYHVYAVSDTRAMCNGSLVSGHAYSADGVTWKQSPVQPFDNTYTVAATGATMLVSTRERPKLLFNAAGVPTHLVSAVADSTGCAPGPCVNCKTVAGVWTFTLSVPLRT